MRIGVAVAILLSHAPLVSRQPLPASGANRHAQMLNLTPLTQSTVRRAIDLARVEAGPDLGAPAFMTTSSCRAAARRDASSTNLGFVRRTCWRAWCSWMEAATPSAGRGGPF